MSGIARITTGVRISRAVVHNGLAFVSGQTAADRSLDIGDQTKQVLSKIDAVLAQAGTDKSHILFAQIWLKDIARDFTGMNEIWDTWLSPNCAPARATAQCAMASPDILVEIIVTAAMPAAASDAGDMDGGLRR